MGEAGCCGPSRGGEAGAKRPAAAQAVVPQSDANTFVLSPRVAIPGGTALVGTASPQIPDDGEGPLRRVSVKPFAMSQGAITNAEFAGFVEATGYVTEAERFGWSFVFWSDVADKHEAT